MIVDTQKHRIDFIRFGVVEDRTFLHDRKITRTPHIQIWAHRGASEYAPENTLEAFQLAIDMKADGVELDVQFTKDRQLVVLHDERIDRTSDGSGFTTSNLFDGQC